MRRLLEQADLKLKVGTLLLMMLSAGAVGALAANAMHLGWMIAVTIGLAEASPTWVWSAPPQAPAVRGPVLGRSI
jgi:hypothetical protein